VDLYSALRLETSHY